jgi:hypothetical protein
VIEKDVESEFLIIRKVERHPVNMMLPLRSPISSRQFGGNHGLASSARRALYHFSALRVRAGPICGPLFAIQPGKHAGTRQRR